MKVSYTVAACAAAAVACFSRGTDAAEGEFSTLTYNVNGIPDLFSESPTKREYATKIISCYVNDYDIVNVQEDFNFHAALYDTCNTHEYRTPTTGGIGIGSGLNTLSHFPFAPVERVRWADCAGVDCLTPKGYTVAQIRLAEGVYVDVYNMHSQAGSSDAELEKRRANTREMIRAAANGNAVMLIGDTNTRYTRCGDSIYEALGAGFTDAWIELIRSGIVPEHCTDAMVCHPDWVTAPDCEIVDKVLYRGNNFITFQATEYVVRKDAVDIEGLELSDHPPVSTKFKYVTAANVSATDMVGGNGGRPFNTVNLIVGAGSSRLRSVTIRGDQRIDALAFTLQNNIIQYIGGSGGSDASIVLEEGEFFESAEVCVGNRNTDRIFFMSLTTSRARTVENGRTTDECYSWSAPVGYAIQGFQGRAENEVDKIGVIYTAL